MKYDDGIYKVKKGETITATVTQSQSLGHGQIVATLDGNDANFPVSFQVTREPGAAHQLSVIYYFVNAPNGKYTITITGDEPNSDTVVREIYAPLPENHIKVNYRFRVVN